jgi:hypothetical protein
MTQHLQVGDSITALWTEPYVDHVSEGSRYKVTRVTNIGFYIINDKGDEVFPISTQFKREAS